MNGKQDGSSLVKKVKPYYQGYARTPLVLAFVGFAFIAVLVFAFWRATRHHWPPIKDPDLLVQECKGLMSRYGQQSARSSWPQSVRDLHPIDVVVGSEHTVFLPFSYGGGLGGGQWSYLIFDSPKQVEEFKGDDTKVLPTNHPNVFKWE